VSLAFFEDMYSRNLGQLFVSPLRVTELTGALLAISFLRTLIGIRWRRSACNSVIQFFYFRAGFAAARIFREPAGDGVVYWSDGGRDGTALRPGGGEFCMGINFCDSSIERDLLAGVYPD
jgi:hypothetical protein